MSSKSNFRPRLIEPTLLTGAPGFGVEIEFYEHIPGLKGDTIAIYLTEEATLENAEAIIDMLAQFGSSIKITNPK